MKIGFNNLGLNSLVNAVSENGRNFFTQLDKRIYIVAALCFAVLVTALVLIYRSLEGKKEKASEKSVEAPKKVEPTPEPEPKIAASETLPNPLKGATENETNHVSDSVVNDTNQISSSEEPLEEFSKEALKELSIEPSEKFSREPSENPHVVTSLLGEHGKKSGEASQPTLTSIEAGDSSSLEKLEIPKLVEGPRTIKQILENVGIVFSTTTAELQISQGGESKVTDSLEESDKQPFPKKTIAERIANNLVLAIQQQISDSLKGKGFSIDQEEKNPQAVKILKHGYIPTDMPIETHSASVAGYAVGAASCEGCRSGMEDADLFTEISFNVEGKECKAQLYGVFDGHGGARASAFVKENFKKTLEKTLSSKAENGLNDEAIWNALKETFITLDKEYDKYYEENRKEYFVPRRGDEQDGTTITAALIIENQIFVANTGDSRTILCHGEETLQLSEDAKPDMERYHRTIQNRGGFILYNGCFRVNGTLGVARAIGDNQVLGKDGKPCVVPNPKITRIPLDQVQEEEDYLVLACDGLYDVSTSNEVGEAVRLMAKEGCTPEVMAQRLVYSAIKNGSQDNVSVVVVKLKPQN